MSAKKRTASVLPANIGQSTTLSGTDLVSSIFIEREYIIDLRFNILSMNIITCIYVYLYTGIYDISFYRNYWFIGKR